MIKKSIILLAFCMVFLPAFAEEDYSSLFDTSDSSTDQTKTENSNDDGFSVKKEFKLSFYGDHSFTFHAPVIPDHLDFKGEIKAPRFSNLIGLEINYKDLKIKTEADIDIRLNEFGSWTDVLSILPGENYISWSPWKLKLAAGFQYFSWGVADGINPTDNINPRNFSTGSAQEKLSILSASASFYPVNFFSMDVVYVPFEQQDKFPLNVAEEFPVELFNTYSFDNTADSLPILMGGGNPILSTIDNGRNVNYQSFNYDPRYFVLGGKTNFRFPVIDFSFSYLYDLDPFWTPVLTLEKAKVNNTPYTYPGPIPVPAIYIVRIKEIELQRKRIHRFGADFKVLIKKVSLWGEFCYSMTEDYLMNSNEIRNHKLSWTAGLDFNYGPNDDFYFNFQYYGDFIPGFDTAFYQDYEDGLPDQKRAADMDYMKEYYYRAFTNRLAYYNEGLMQGVTLAMKWPVLNNLLTPSLALSYSFPLLYDYDYEKRFGGMYINPELDIMPIDSFHILVGADLYFAWKEKDGGVSMNEDDRMGRFNQDSNIYIALQYKWGVDIER